MAFFGLTDIKFNDIQQRTSGPLGALDSSPFINNALRYPIDVGTSVDKGHYMIFFVREQINTNFSAESRGGSITPVNKNLVFSTVLVLNYEETV
jgi:hypothetical protein